MLSNKLRSVNSAALEPYRMLYGATITNSIDRCALLPDITNGVIANIFWKTDGKELYIADNGLDVIHQYTLGTAYDLWTITNKKQFSVSTWETFIRSLFISPDGTKLFFIGSTGDDVNQFTLSTPWDITSATYNDVWTQPATIETSPTGIFFKPDGTRFYIGGYATDTIRQFDISGTPWNIGSGSTVSLAGSWTNTLEITMNGMYIHPDGTYVYFSGTSGDDITQVAMTSAWDITSITTTGNTTLPFDPATTGISTVGSSSVGMSMSWDGNYAFMMDDIDMSIGRFPLYTPWDITSIGPVGPYPHYFDTRASTLFTINDTPSSGLVYSPDGTKAMGIHGGSDNQIVSYVLSTPWDLRTMSVVNMISVDYLQTGGLSGFSVSPDGLHIIFTDHLTADVVRYIKSNNPWNLTSIVSTTSLSFADFDSSVYLTAWNEDGTLLTLVTGFHIAQFICSTPYTLAGVNFATPYREVANIGTHVSPVVTIGTGRGQLFTPDGKHFYSCNSTMTRMYHFVMTTPWDITTLSHPDGIPDVIDIALIELGLPSEPGKIIEVDGKTFLEIQYNTDIYRIELRH